MEKLTEQEKQQVRNQVFQPIAKFIGTLLFEAESKFEKKLVAFEKKLVKNTGYNSIKHSCKFMHDNVKTSLYVKPRDNSEVMSVDIVVQKAKK